MNWDDHKDIVILYQRIGEYLELVEKYAALTDLVKDVEVEVRNINNSVTISSDYLDPVIDETEALIKHTLSNLKKDYGN